MNMVYENYGNIVGMSMKTMNMDQSGVWICMKTMNMYENSYSPEVLEMVLMNGNIMGIMENYG